jgi:outer membrane protein assembly factor BamB
MKVLRVAFALAILLASTSAQASNEWPTFMGNPERNGASGTTVDRALSWDRTITPGIPHYESVIERDGVVYLTTDLDSPRGPGVLALYAQDGSEAWFHPAPKAPSTAGVALADDLVLAAATNGGTDVIAVNATTGALVWETDTGQSAGAALVVGGGEVFEPTKDGMIALDLKTGKIEWRANDGEMAGSPAFADGKVFYSGWNGTFHARDIDGGLIWAVTPPPQGLASAPLIVNDTAYVLQNKDHLIALSARTGEVRWTVPMPENTLLDSPTLADGNIVVTSGGTVFAYSLDGHVQWSTHAGQRFVYGATARGNRIVVADESGELTFLDAKTGAILSRFQTNVHGFLAPLAWDGPHIFLSGLGPSASHVLEARVYALNVPSGVEKTLGLSGLEWGILAALGIGGALLAIWLPRRRRSG